MESGVLEDESIGKFTSSDFFRHLKGLMGAEGSPLAAWDTLLRGAL